ncbi:UNVERIFIED_CONTAM: hypothetical protein GTU68_022215 [Idotea baltica]|nr:hypothetical protein [Idotea baltica]
MDWNSCIIGYKSYLLLEKGLSAHTIEGYLSDVHKLHQYVESFEDNTSPGLLIKSNLTGFLKYLYELGLSARTQARIISGIKSFYTYLLLENLVDQNVAKLLDNPTLSRKIPEVLTIEEVNDFLAAIDLSHPQGQRNRAMFEILYACGLRVTELIELKLSNLYFDIGVIKVLGKNNKERLVPIGNEAIKHTNTYLETERIPHAKPAKGHENIVFLNRRGRQLTRNMVFMLCQQYSKSAGITKRVSPHTFRHTFATHLVEGGADLRAVQDMLGHVSITTTEIYTHLDARFLRETIDMYHPRGRVNLIKKKNND